MKFNRSPLMDELVPSEFYLSQNYPNPFSQITTIKYCIAYKTKVRLEVIDPEGETIKILIDEEKESGSYEVEFNTCGLPEGVYTYQLQAGNYLENKKMILLC